MITPPEAPEAGPLISVVTVCMNSAATLERTIRSVASQTYGRIEYVVVDGGSTDATLEIIKRHEGAITRWISEPDEGIYDAMNKGIGLATGDLIILVNADDFLEPDAAEVVVAEHRRHPEAEILHGQVRMVGPDGKPGHILTRSDDVVSNRFKRIPVLHPACFVTRACYERIGLYDARLRSSGDQEFFQRAIDRAVVFHYIPRVLTNMTEGGFSIRNHRTAMRETHQIRLRYGCPPLRARYYYVRSVVLFSLVHRWGDALALKPLYRFYRKLKYRRGTGENQP